MSFGPKPIVITDIFVHAIGACIAGSIWAIFILMVTFLLGGVIDIQAAYWANSLWNKTGAFFPIMLSVITFLGTSISIFLSYFLLSVTAPERYKRNLVMVGQLSLFIILLYIFVTPVYLYAGLQNYDYIMYVYLFHVIIAIFWSSLILEILNNYRHILIWLYGSFIGMFLSTIIAIVIFQLFESGIAKLVVLVALLPIILFITYLCKHGFEYIYLQFVKITNQDSIGDIFYRIQQEEAEILREEEEKNSL